MEELTQKDININAIIYEGMSDHDIIMDIVYRAKRAEGELNRRIAEGCKSTISAGTKEKADAVQYGIIAVYRPRVASEEAESVTANDTQ